MSDSARKVVSLGSIGFRYVAREDRILCTGALGGLTTTDRPARFWLTHRLAKSFLERAHEALSKPARPEDRPAAREPASETLLRYGTEIQKARVSTTSQVDVVKTDIADMSAWLVSRITLRKPKDRWQLFFLNSEEAVGISLSMEELLRVIDMLEAAFVAGEWPVPGGSYRHVGRIAAEEQGQTLN